MRATSDDRIHQRTQELLPWWVNGTLEGAEARSVEEHLAECGVCRREEARCRRLAELVRGGGEVAPAPHPAQLERLLAVIAGEQGGMGRHRRAGASRLPSWLRDTPTAVRWLLAAQLAAMLALAGGLTLGHGGSLPASSDPAPVAEERPGAFRTLASAQEDPGSRARLRLVFAPGVSEREIRGLLLELRGEIVGGPTPLGSYTIELPVGPVADPIAVVLEHLRESPWVRFAEPVATSETSGAGDG